MQSDPATRGSYQGTPESSTDAPELIMPQPCASERPSLGTESTAQDRALFPPKGSTPEPREEKRKRERERERVRGEGRRLDIKRALHRKVEFSNLRAGSTGGSQGQ